MIITQDGKEIARTTTDENGFYKFEGLNPGKYAISVKTVDGGTLMFEDRESTVIAGQEDKNNDWGFYKERSSETPEPSTEPSTSEEPSTEEPSPEPSPSEEPEPSPSEEPTPSLEKSVGTPDFGPAPSPIVTTTKREVVEKSTVVTELNVIESQKEPSTIVQKEPEVVRDTVVVPQSQSQSRSQSPIVYQSAPSQPVQVIKKTGPAVHTGGEIVKESFWEKLLHIFR